MKHTEDADDCYFLTDPRDLLWTNSPGNHFPIQKKSYMEGCKAIFGIMHG